MSKPRARADGLVVRSLAGETLVYDLERHRVHCLNRTTALVWRCCDGRSDVVRIASRVARETAAPADEALVWLALRQLDKARLLQDRLHRGETPQLSRREVARRLGLSVALLPLIATVLAPTPAEAAACSAATNRDIGCPCTSVAQCVATCTTCPNGHNCSVQCGIPVGGTTALCCCCNGGGTGNCTCA